MLTPLKVVPRTELQNMALRCLKFSSILHPNRDRPSPLGDTPDQGHLKLPNRSSTAQLDWLWSPHPSLVDSAAANHLWKWAFQGSRRCSEKKHLGHLQWIFAGPYFEIFTLHHLKSNPLAHAPIFPAFLVNKRDMGTFTFRPSQGNTQLPWIPSHIGHTIPQHPQSLRFIRKGIEARQLWHNVPRSCRCFHGALCFGFCHQSHPESTVESKLNILWTCLNSEHLLTQSKASSLCYGQQKNKICTDCKADIPTALLR